MMSSYTDYNQGSPQLEWLKDDLASIDRAKTPFVVGVLHAPWYNSNTHHSNETEEFFFAQSAEDLMHDYKVDLILAGHVHAYERSYPVYHNQVVGPEDGTVYVTCGDGGNREGHAVPWKYPEPEWSAYRRAARRGFPGAQWKSKGRNKPRTTESRRHATGGQRPLAG